MENKIEMENKIGESVRAAKKSSCILLDGASVLPVLPPSASNKNNSFPLAPHRHTPCHTTPHCHTPCAAVGMIIQVKLSIVAHVHAQLATAWDIPNLLQPVTMSNPVHPQLAAARHTQNLLQPDTLLNPVHPQLATPRHIHNLLQPGTSTT